MRVVLVTLVVPCLLIIAASFFGATSARGNGAEVLTRGAGMWPASILSET
jgi:hypothetical protein